MLIRKAMRRADRRPGTYFTSFHISSTDLTSLSQKDNLQRERYPREEALVEAVLWVKETEVFERENGGVVEPKPGDPRAIHQLLESLGHLQALPNCLEIDFRSPFGTTGEAELLHPRPSHRAYGHEVDQQTLLSDEIERIEPPGLDINA